MKKVPKQSGSNKALQKTSKRGMSGTYDTMILCETADKEERCRENFAANGMFMKMPRNPINGELTARDGAPYAIPFHHSIMLKMEESKVVVPEPRPVVKIAQYVDERDTTFARQNPLVEVVRHKIDTVKQPHLQTLRDKRAAMDNEISQMQRLAEYQRSMLLQSGGRAPHAVP